jgi:hypothetical protein
VVNARCRKHYSPKLSPETVQLSARRQVSVDQSEKPHGHCYVGGQLAAPTLMKDNWFSIPYFNSHKPGKHL